MKTRVQRWGNSLAIRIPKSFAGDLGLEDNSPVELSLEEGAAVIKPDRKREWNLDALLAAVTEENIPPPWDSGGADGNGEEADSGDR